VGISPFHVESEVEPGGVAIITVRGELDMGTAPDLEAPLAEALSDPDSKILLDFSDCEFIDSTGVALVVRSWQSHDASAEAGGTGRLVLCCPGAQVERLLELTGVASAISIHGDRDRAIADLRA
jgi:anti-sigma B factor antagonist